MKNKRQIRKAALAYLSDRVSPQAIDYASRVRPAKGKAKLIGVAVASAVYFLGFGGGYYGWARGVVPDQAFFKLVWILMVPSAVTGAVAWMLFEARLEYPLRQSLAEFIEPLESTGGLLWRFQPLVASTTIKGVDVAYAVERSRSGDGARIDPQDYCAILQIVYRSLNSDEDVLFTNEIARQLAENLSLPFDR